ncbi:type III secretion system needle filament subunit SctF [unidentified bacterial endosymbiont]|uniref:type III secretion system needle filament subunit SctF n=1 Tax=unidentified bacterial endosymbiont TaxID=2355 RepID=UPI0020A146D0|nr:type III secretion system needle filament subunit SctF [unidentified bacterial endosymbiont]
MNVDQIINSLSQMAHSAGNAVTDQLNSQNMNNPESMVKAQFAVQQYSNFISYESAIIKTIKDMLSGVIAKI